MHGYMYMAVSVACMWSHVKGRINGCTFGRIYQDPPGDPGHLILNHEIIRALFISTPLSRLLDPPVGRLIRRPSITSRCTERTYILP